MLLLNDYENSYEQLLEKPLKSNMIPLNKILCIEIYKIVNSLSADFMKNIFEMKKNNRVIRDRYQLNLNIPRTNHVMFGTNSVKSYAPNIWNALTFNKVFKVL